MVTLDHFMEKNPTKMKEKQHTKRLPMSNISCLSSPLNIIWLGFTFKGIIPLAIRSGIARVHALLLGKMSLEQG